MGKALYRKYRSKSLDEIVGQEHITTTLANALKSGAISHAYLFTGPRGTGKTSIARILAHEVNQLPYSDDAHLDIIEIDAASNRRIDEIRELRERVHVAPTSAKYKVYIIDEVHMLTKEAFNALLKTLEEPPAHVIFILATTESHKLPETIISRTQRFSFKPVETGQVTAHLRHIAEQEGIDISDEALTLIAQHGGGSFRDSISLLDQLGGHGNTVTPGDVQSMLGIAPDELIENLLTVLQSGTVKQLINLLTSCNDQGYRPAHIAKQLSQKLRSQLLGDAVVLPPEVATDTLHKLLAVPAAFDQEAALELALLGVILQRSPPAVVVAIEPPPTPKPAAASKPKKAATPTPHVEAKETAKPAETPAQQVTAPASGGLLDDSLWQDVLAAVKQSHNTLYSVVRMATPRIENNQITLAFSFAFHQKRLSEPKNKQVIADIIQKVSGQPYMITCIVVPASGEVTAAPSPLNVASDQPDTLSTISNIFGGGEVLES